MYLTGTVRERVIQMPLLINDLVMCISNERQSSLQSSYANQFRCIKTYLFPCLLTSNRIAEIHSRGNSTKSPASPRYCGALFLNEYNVHSLDMVLFIELIKGHILYYKILKFNFRTSRFTSCGDHGLVFYYQGFRSEYYCGRRIPWTVIIRSDKSFIHLVIKSYLKYELSIFYSSFHRNWIRRFIHVKLLHFRSNELKFNEENIYSVQCYVLAEHNKRIHLNVLSTGPLKGSVMAHDGPGRLSNTILQLDNIISPANAKASTTAYWAFLEVVLPKMTDTVIKIIVQLDSMTRLAALCYRHGTIYIPENSIYRGNIICSSLFEAPSHRMFLSLIVHNFIFHGPNMLSDTSPSSCQYGGFIVYLHPGDKGFEMCQDTRDLHIGSRSNALLFTLGGGPRVVVSTAAFHARVRGSVPGLGGLKETKLFLPHPRVKVSIVGSLRDREVACSASDRQGSNFESCVWRTVSSQSSHHPQDVLLAQFSLYVHKGGLKPDSFHFICSSPSFGFMDIQEDILWEILALGVVGRSI